MEALVKEGRDHYMSKKYHGALKQFTRAMYLCACMRGLKRPRCSCKDFESVAANNGSILDEAMHTCVCDVGKTFDKCSNHVHIMALDYRAGTFEAINELGRAQRDAEWMLELAPRMPDGYLRLGKIARLQKKAELAWKVYTAGVEASKDGAPGSSRKLQQLHEALGPLRRRFIRQDPMSLPMDIVHLIFAELDVVDLTNCVRVSRTWRQTLQDRACKGLWSLLIFPRRRRFQPPSGLALQKLLARTHGGAREIEIREPISFQLTPLKLEKLLRCTPSLGRLTLGRLPNRHFSFPQDPELYKNLRYVSLDTHDQQELSGWQNDEHISIEFLRRISLRLEHLDLHGVPERWCWSREVPYFPRLKSLRLSRNKGRHHPFPIFYVVYQMPRLKQLSLTNVQLCISGYAGESTRRWSSLCKHLEAFTFVLPETGSSREFTETRTCLTMMMAVNDALKLRHVDLELPYENDGSASTDAIFTPAVTWTSPGYPAEGGFQLHLETGFDELRELRLRSLVHAPAMMAHVLQETMGKGNLDTLDIVFPLETMDGDLAQQHARHLAGYDWLRGLASVRCMGVSRFRFRDFAHRDDDFPLPGFLASFPSLETLSLDSEHYDASEFCLVVEAVLKRARLKTLYQDSVSGAAWDRLVEIGPRYGVRIVSGARPREWPVLRQD